MGMRGFTLIEVLVALGILAGAGAGVGSLMVLAGQSVVDARADLVATTAARSGMAALRARLWGYDAAGARQADPAFLVVPAGSLDASAPGYSDLVSSSGAVAAGASDAAFVRRWRVSPAPVDPVDTLVLEVSVTRVGRPAAREVYLVSVLTRTRS
jgi:prepilin-type N-terminal cleavage/methylation domain-containing protein